MRGRTGVLLALVLTSQPSCTLLGLGTGAAVDGIVGPRHVEGTFHEVEPLERGDFVRVATRSGYRTEGTYLGIRLPKPDDPEARFMVRDARENLIALRYSDVARVGVERPRKGWLYGTLVGAAIDVAVVVGILAVQPGYDSCWGCGENSPRWKFK
jgi:hypothetical protein